ncbi:MAG: hypothetical protein ACTSRZ_19130 [Promethearchaeota archaeon]
MLNIDLMQNLDSLFIDIFNKIRGILVIIGTIMMIPFFLNIMSHRRIGKSFLYFIIGFCIVLIFGLDSLELATWNRI